MIDCVFVPVCSGYCKCSAYLSENTDEGYELQYEYWNRIREVTEPIEQWLEGIKNSRLQEECDE